MMGAIPNSLSSIDGPHHGTIEATDFGEKTKANNVQDKNIAPARQSRPGAKAKANNDPYTIAIPPAKQPKSDAKTKTKTSQGKTKPPTRQLTSEQRIRTGQGFAQVMGVIPKRT